MGDQVATGAHAVLSPSGASRWLACTPSARLEMQFEDKAGEAAEEGTVAHSLSELIIRYKTNQLNELQYKQRLRKIKRSKYYSSAMEQHCDDYASYVIRQFLEAKNKASGTRLYLEQKLDLSEFIPEGFGTTDSTIVTDGVLCVTDLKYGKGVRVEAEANKQLMIYALGAYLEHSWLFTIHTVKMTIFQPRLDNISSYELPINDLLTWASEELAPKARLAFDGAGEFKAGAHCQFCKAAGVCKANAAFNQQLARHDFAEPELLTDEEIAEIIANADLHTKWLKAVSDYALNKAKNQGKTWPGFKLVEGRSNRQILQPSEAITALKLAGFKEKDFMEPRSLLGVTALEKLLTPRVFSEVLGQHVTKPPGAPTLAPVSDKRPAIGSGDSARKDFETVTV